MTLRHRSNPDGTLLTWSPHKPKDDSNMSIDDVMKSCQTIKEIGHTSKIMLPISVVMQLAEEAKRYRELSKFEKAIGLTAAR